ncbi:MAG: ATP synthase F0 subunit A [Bacteroidetes bacterium GWA2_32_17]|nr:MAG: ATP synthase F0 subunit A [Bacteroidetes bacterium GWA2_32_17]
MQLQTKLYINLFLIIALLFFGLNIKASEHKTDSLSESGSKNEETFKPGEFIINHVIDNHEWHIAEISGTEITIPLPIIVYSYKQGLLFFMSSKFEHGEKSYSGLKLETEGVNKGKIVEVLEDGNTVDEEAKLPLDLSITKIVSELFIVIFLMLWIFISVAKSYKRRQNLAPKGIQSLMEPLIIFVRDDIARPSIGHTYQKYLPYLLTIFFFIFISNLLGLIPIFPGGANLTGNIAVTGILALFTFTITTINANATYWKHIINAPCVPWWLKIPIPLMPIVELIGVFTKPFVLMVRLFANITAGHIIALGFFSLIFIFGKMSLGAGYGISVLSVIFTVFMSMLELLVAFIQAYVFTLLSAIYFGLATEEHH